MSGKRYRFVLVEEPESLAPVRHRPRHVPGRAPVWVHSPDPLEALLEAFMLLDRRGEGDHAWAPALAENPLSFLLDALEEAVMLRDEGGRVVFCNQAAQRLGLREAIAPADALEDGRQRVRRRRMVYRRGARSLVVEVAQRLGR